jgi:hypothetical protein
MSHELNASPTGRNERASVKVLAQDARTDSSVVMRRTPAGTRRQLPGLASYALLSAVVGLGLFASVVPSPFYATYGLPWYCSTLTLILVYATYAASVPLAPAQAAGRMQDGWRPVLLVSLAVLTVPSVLYIVAASVAWLFAARPCRGWPPTWGCPPRRHPCSTSAPGQAPPPPPPPP